MTREILIQLKQVRDISHENLNPFIGACIESPNIMMVWSYCKKGSLKDVLANDEYKIDYGFKLSMAIDIAAGMKYLHNTSVKFHGNLTSTRCVIDSHWVVKITDWGLHEFKAGQENTKSLHKMYYDLLWTAPEHINISKVEREGFSQKGDVYSYGILLQEMSFRSEPYSRKMLQPKVIIHRVVAHEDPPFRPDVPSMEMKPEYIELMVDCWNDEPEERPHFYRIVERLKKESGRGSNIIENMVTMMEKHANHLEQLVEERTRQLNEEKEKTEKILYRLLPPLVVDQLKSDNTVQAEGFEEVTIFFSDIVGFTKLASMSTPLEIVGFLNDLYVSFDEIISRFDVYKVETVGDAYVVVSGCPKKNGIKHASEIASMALELLSHMTVFRVRHLPDHQLQLRIGINTGPVVAAVVGVTMPRFCLYGHTVNIASKLESTCLPLRIHVSSESHSRLVEVGGFYLEERGQVQIKRQGLVTTYWLVGKEGFDKALPDPPLDFSEPLFETLDVYYAS
ncbi:atrial natriuretic peptide receptor 1-like [Pocillopora verrucosa]|nr:atrial natriuretic peptide receptor 1-like [Pocillopora verrucosa]